MKRIPMLLAYDKRSRALGVGNTVVYPSHSKISQHGEDQLRIERAKLIVTTVTKIERSDFGGFAEAGAHIWVHCEDGHVAEGDSEMGVFDLLLLPAVQQ